MKKLLVLAMVLVLAAPMFAEMSIGGEFDYYMVNGFESDGGDNGNSFVDNWDKGEVDFKATVGDYSQVRIELEEDGSWNRASNGTVRDGSEGTPSFTYFRVITDWGKFFGLDGITIKTDIGLNSWETFDAVDFTGYNYENADSEIFIDQPATAKDFGAKISLGFVDGLVQPYFAWTFDTVNENDGAHDPSPDGEFECLVGSGFDFNAMGLPLWFEAYFHKAPVEDINTFGVEAMYDLAIGDMNFKLGGHFLNTTNGDDRGSAWGLGIGFEAFGAAINVSGGGYFGEDFWGENSAFSVMGIDAEYFFLDWLGVNAGASFAFGDFKETQAGDEAFQSFEAGVVVKPDKGVVYKLGYIYANEDAIAVNRTTGAKTGSLTTRTLNTKKLAGEKGGLYFVTKIDF